MRGCRPGSCPERTGRTQLLDDGYIARRSRHNKGVAIDLTRVHLPTNTPLEMGTPYDTFSAAAHTANATPPGDTTPSGSAIAATAPTGKP